MPASHALSTVAARVFVSEVSRSLHGARVSARGLERARKTSCYIEGLYRERAYSSMFDYCVRALHMSEAESCLRIRAARLSRQFPRVLHMLQAGELHLSQYAACARNDRAGRGLHVVHNARFGASV
jgi:hypothetical protein